MSSDELALRVHNVSKRYQIYRQKHHRLLQTLFGDRKKLYKEFWALHDISFDVKQGECVGIIGRNGSGKSTLLQIIAGTLAPTTGELEIRGRVSALLELGSGFNPEFTGRENVYMNGTVLGLSPRQIEEKFEQIAEFADIGDFIEQPTKTYSSGMVVRLAFAVQVLVEPDFLIVDEALSVGDAAFQIKCMARMQRLLERGATILIVSHSVQTIRTYCNRAIWLDQGRMREAGLATDVCSAYVEFLFSGSTTGGAVQANRQASAANAADMAVERIAVDRPGRADPLRRWGSGEIRVARFSMTGDKTGPSPTFEHLEQLEIVFEASVGTDFRADAIAMAIAVRDVRGIDLIAVSSAERKQYWTELGAGDTIEARFRFKNIVNPGEYMLILAVEYFVDGKRQYSDYIENAHLFQCISDRKHHGIVEPEIDLKLNRNRSEIPA